MSIRLTSYAFVLFIATPAFGQESATSIPQTAAPAAVRSHDLSLFTQSGGPLKEGEGSFDVQGGIYRWAKPTKRETFWKVGVGFGSSFAIPVRRTQPVSGDSAYNIETWKDERVYMLLGGVETQRHLTKGIYLTAGFEAQAGASNGRLDSVARLIPGANTNLNGDVIGSPVRIGESRQYFVSGLALLGIRAYAGRFTGALELFTGAKARVLSQKLSRTDITERARSYSIFDLGLGGSGTRISLGYRF